MTSSEPKKQSPRERLRALYAAKFPDSPVPSRAGDRTLVQSSMTTETELIALYSEAYGVPVLPEDEIRQPEAFRWSFSMRMRVCPMSGRRIRSPFLSWTPMILTSSPSWSGRPGS